MWVPNYMEIKIKYQKSLHDSFRDDQNRKQIHKDRQNEIKARNSPSSSGISEHACPWKPWAIPWRAFRTGHVQSPHESSRGRICCAWFDAATRMNTTKSLGWWIDSKLSFVSVYRASQCCRKGEITEFRCSNSEAIAYRGTRRQKQSFQASGLQPLARSTEMTTFWS